jgi:acyl dehydratase
MRADWVGREFDVADFEVEESKLLEWAEACGETDPRFIDPAHPDFQAHPGYTTQYHGGRVFPPDFPHIGKGLGIDGGKCVNVHEPIRPGDRLTAKSSIADIYEKTGRSGAMIFIVHRMTFQNQEGRTVATVDWRLIQSPGRPGRSERGS